MITTLSRRRFLAGLGALAGAAIFPAGVPAALSGGKDEAAFEFLVIGDSLVWGQGLEEEQKFYHLTKLWLADEILAGKRKVNVKVLAHSGATIRLDDAEAKVLRAAERDVSQGVHPEINVSFPAIKSQLSEARLRYPDPESVDLVMLSGGVPEVGIANILDPFQSNDELRSDIRLYCYEHMSVLLHETSKAFPKALIAVIGYYPIITAHTPIKRIVSDILDVYNWPQWTKPLLNNPLKRVLWRRYRRKMITRSQIWLEGSTSELQKAVSETNAKTGRNSVLFVRPPFSTENAYGAKNTLLWKVAKRGRAADPMRGARGEACRATLGDLRVDTGLTYRTRLCELASIGHPNVEGSAAIAAEIRKTIGPHLAAKVSNL